MLSKQLKSKLYELELQKQNEERQVLEESKSDIGWGSQVRSYVLDQSRIKDLRTGFCATAKPVPYCVSSDVNLASVPASPL